MHLELPFTGREKEMEIIGMFLKSLDDPLVSEALEDALVNDGSFRDFKNAVARFDLGRKWMAFRNRAYEAMAVKWCENNGLEYGKD